jgi:hypothetical protein
MIMASPSVTTVRVHDRDTAVKCLAVQGLREPWVDKLVPSLLTPVPLTVVDPGDVNVNIP